MATSGSDKAFEVKNVVKHFETTKALDGVSLNAKAGTIFGLLGPNGAGKTTLVRMLSTLITPDKGSVEVLGVDAVAQPQKVRELIGLAGQFAAVDEFQTGFENVYMTGRLYHLSPKVAKQRTNELLERLGLADAAKRPVKTYSGGMHRRLDLGASLIGHPQVMFLDEPTTGLDPRTRLDLWEIIRDLVKEGTSILLTTQYLEEADELADQIAVMNYGKIIAEGTADQLKTQLGGDVVEVEIAKASDKDKALMAIRSHSRRAATVADDGVTIKVPVAQGATSLLGIVQELGRAHIAMKGVALHRPSLDDVFLSLTGDKSAAPTTAQPTERKKVQL